MCIVIWLLISRFLCLPSELKIRGVALTLIHIFIFVVAHEQEWPCKYTSNREIACTKRLTQAEGDIWRQRSPRNADVQTALTNNLQRARYGRPSRCVKDCSTIDQDKRIRERDTHDGLAQFTGELPNRRQFKGSQQDTDETNGGFSRPELYSSARHSDIGHIPGELDAMALRKMFGLPPKSLSEQELWGLQKSINHVQTQCVRKIVKILATYAVKHLPQCNKKQAINAAAFNHKTNHAQQQRPVHKQEAISQWSKTVPLEPVHTQTENEVQNVNMAVKNTGGATFVKTRHQHYKPSLVQRRPQKEGTEKYLVNTMGPYIREQLKAEKTETRKVIPARNENESRSSIGSKVGPNAKNHKVVPVQYQTQRDSSALWKSQHNSYVAVQEKDSLPLLNAPELPKGVKGNWKPQPPRKSEFLPENNIKAPGPVMQPFRGASSIHYSRETALNRQRIRQGGQTTGEYENDETRHIGLNSRSEEYMRRQNAATRNKFVQRIVKPSVDVRANAQYKKQQGKTILSTQMGHAALHGETHEETIASLLPPPDQSLKYRHRNLDGTKGQHVAEHLLSSQRAEKGTHGHVLMELQENSLELLEEKTLPQDTVVGSRLTNLGKSGSVKTVGEVSIKGQPARLSSQRMSAEKPRSYRSKAHLRPQGRFPLDDLQEEGPNHKTRSGVRADLEDDSIADLRRPAQRRSAQIPVAGPSPTIEEESISPRTPNRISNHAPQNVRLRNSEPPREKEKQNEQALIRRLTAEAQPPTKVKQASRRSMTVQETGLPHNLAIGLGNGRQGHTPQNSMPISAITKPQRTALTGRLNSVLDHHSRSHDSSGPGFSLRVTSAQHPTLLHKRNFAPGSIKQPLNKRQPHLAQVTTQRAPILNQLNHSLISRPRPEAVLHKSASGDGATKVVQPTHIHQMAAAHGQQPTAKPNPSSVEATGSSESYRNIVTSKPFVKTKPTRLVHTQRPILRHRDKVGSSGVQIPKKKQNIALVQKIANLPMRVLITKRTSPRRLLT